MSEETSELERLVERSRRIGADPALVVHGGGNTSTKLRERDHLGRERDVMRVKGSGTDLRTIQLLMGHERLEHTTVYLHLSGRHLHAAVNPLEQITLRAVQEEHQP